MFGLVMYGVPVLGIVTGYGCPYHGCGTLGHVWPPRPHSLHLPHPGQTAIRTSST